MQRLNTCTRCILRTSSSLESLQSQVWVIQYQRIAWKRVASSTPLHQQQTLSIQTRSNHHSDPTHRYASRRDSPGNASPNAFKSIRRRNESNDRLLEDLHSRYTRESTLLRQAPSRTDTQGRRCSPRVVSQRSITHNVQVKRIARLGALEPPATVTGWLGGAWWARSRSVYKGRVFITWTGRPGLEYVGGWCPLASAGTTII
jgi:hypothetical protein